MPLRDYARVERLLRAQLLRRAVLIEVCALRAAIDIIVIDVYYYRRADAAAMLRC